MRMRCNFSEPEPQSNCDVDNPDVPNVIQTPSLSAATGDGDALMGKCLVERSVKMVFKSRKLI